MHYVINVKAEKLERFYVEVMFPFGSGSLLSQFYKASSLVSKGKFHELP